MIQWLIQSNTAHPDLAAGVAPIGLLSEREQHRFAALKTEKRRRDWLIGRWTAKHLLQACLANQISQRIPLDALTIGNDPDGAPFFSAPPSIVALSPPLPSRRERPTLSPSRSLPSSEAKGSRVNSVEGGAGGEGLPLSLSISHSGDRAFCALSDTAGIQIGADIERVERRSWQFVEDYFTAEEIMLVRLAPAEEQDTLITAIWSAKEAALKALRLGLTVDTRGVACWLGAPAQEREWADVAFTCDQRRLGVSAAPALTGWWRRMDEYVVTIAVMSSPLSCNRCYPSSFIVS